jgi:uncharacterized protein YcgL (UPF0745 family)
MANAFYSAEQKKLQATYREAAREHISPLVKEIDETDHVPQALVKKLVQPPFSLPALSVPKKFGSKSASFTCTSSCSAARPTSRSAF